MEFIECQIFESWNKKNNHVYIDVCVGISNNNYMSYTDTQKINSWQHLFKSVAYTSWNDQKSDTFPDVEVIWSFEFLSI